MDDVPRKTQYSSNIAWQCMATCLACHGVAIWVRKDASYMRVVRFLTDKCVFGDHAPDREPVKQDRRGSSF